MRVTINPDGIRNLEHDEGIAKGMLPAAERVLMKARARTPAWVDAQWFVRAGVSARGAYAQAIARGSGVVTAEYGGERSSAHAMFRSSVR